MYHVFISHAWKYDEHYKKLVQWLDESSISYKNYSVPQHDPFDSNVDLERALTEQIKHSNIVLIASGMYVAYSDWIQYEIDEAVRMGKYIIGIEPWGSERVPKKVSENANVTVGWNSSSVIKAIKNA